MAKNGVLEGIDYMKGFEIPQVKLSYKQKIILEALQDEFHGKGFGPQLLEETDNPALKELSINEITWHMLRLRDAALVSSSKKIYKGRELNLYEITEIVKFGAIEIK